MQDKRSSRLAIAAFICSILSFAPILLIFPGMRYMPCFCVPFLPSAGPLLGTIGLVLAIVGIRKREARGKTLAIVTIVLSIFGIGVGLYMFFFWRSHEWPGQW